MAFLDRHGDKGTYRVCFRLNGREVRRSLGTAKEKEANGKLALLERTLADVEQGLLTIPEDADPVVFLLSGGKVAAVNQTSPKRRSSGLPLRSVSKSEKSQNAPFCIPTALRTCSRRAGTSDTCRTRIESAVSGKSLWWSFFSATARNPGVFEEAIWAHDEDWRSIST